MNALLGTRIRSLRESKGYTQEQVAEQMKCTRQKYARIEKGMTDISYSSINTIASILEIDVEDITSVVNKKSKTLYRKNENVDDDVFDTISTMIDTFYAHKKLYNSIRQVDIDE